MCCKCMTLEEGYQDMWSLTRCVTQFAKLTLARDARTRVRHLAAPKLLLLLAGSLILTPVATAAPSAGISPSSPAPSLVGTTITINVFSSEIVVPLYKFEYRLDGGSWRLLKDFSRLTSFDWTPMVEGSYVLRVTVLDFSTFGTTNVSVEATSPYLVQSRVTSAPAVNVTDHPLVALYSVPACSLGSVRARFIRAGGVRWNYTDTRPCIPGKSNNFLIGGMAGNTDYSIQHERIVGPSTFRGAARPFHTGSVAISLPTFSVTNPPGADTDLNEGIVLSAVTIGSPSVGAATARDLFGNVLWYYEDPNPVGATSPVLLRPVNGGTMLFLIADGSEDDIWRWQILREVDLAGKVVRETSAFAASLQLYNLGQDTITAFHHEALRLANGHTLVLANVERVVDGREMFGDMVIDLDERFQVAWTWNGFDHLDTNRPALLGETCTENGGGCPPLFRLQGPAEDWMHANGIDLAPDGDILISVRHQDWIVKIDYDNGAGTGAIVWRLGREGDFDFISGDSWPEFSHQHDAQIESNGLLTVFDNGNTRVGPEGGNSRGQALLLDEVNMTATPIVNADLGAYSFALGSAELLSNGNYGFGAGALVVVGPGPDTGDFVEVDDLGVEVYRNRHSGVGVYRHFRGPSMYAMD